MCCRTYYQSPEFDVVHTYRFLGSLRLLFFLHTDTDRQSVFVGVHTVAAHGSPRWVMRGFSREEAFHRKPHSVNSYGFCWAFPDLLFCSISYLWHIFDPYGGVGSFLFFFTQKKHPGSRSQSCQLALHRSQTQNPQSKCFLQNHIWAVPWLDFI